MHIQNIRSASGSRTLGRSLASGTMLGLALLLATPAPAAFHLWTVREIYTDASGSNQFIEFFTTSGSQQFVNGRAITITPTGGGAAQSFTLPTQLPSDSANRAFIVGTASITNYGAPRPDYVIPNNFVAAGGGTLSYFGQGGGVYPALPTNGVQSRTWVGGASAVNSPQNFAGLTGSISILVFNPPPVVSITSPLNNTIYGTPEVVNVVVSATDAGGSIASVKLLTNGVAAATNAVAPFGFVLNALPVGDYVLRALAQDNGAATATSAPVNVQVLGGPRLIFAPGTNGPVQFHFRSSIGASYVIERALPLTNFTPVVTNPGNGGILQFSDTNGGSSQGTYRVRVE